MLRVLNLVLCFCDNEEQNNIERIDMGNKSSSKHKSTKKEGGLPNEVNRVVTDIVYPKGSRSIFIITRRIRL